MEIVIIVVLAVLVGIVLWDRARGQRRWREQGDALSKIVGERIDGTIRVFGEVQKGLGELTQRTRDVQEVGRNIASLQEILRAPKFRGGLGELLLERLLADSLPRDCYELQYRFRNGETVDAVVRVGQNLVPIDSKFPLEDFERLVEVKSDEEQPALRRQFINAIKKHVDGVSRYILPDENTFEFALMYVPAENIYYETILQSDIYSYCLNRKVFLVSPNSFNAYLQAIILGLKGLRIERTAHQILGRLERLQGDLSAFQCDYDTLGGHIRHAAAKYDEATTKLARLSDRLRLTSEAFEELPEAGTGTGDEGEHEQN